MDTFARKIENMYINLNKTINRVSYNFLSFIRKVLINSTFTILLNIYTIYRNYTRHSDILNRSIHNGSYFNEHETLTRARVNELISSTLC